MNLDQIIATRPELEKIIYAQYPATKLEKTCFLEKNRMDGLRLQMAKRLINHPTKKEYEPNRPHI